MRLLIYIALIFCALTAEAQTLDSYLDTGLKNSPLLKEYNLQLQSGVIDSLKILAGYKPQVGLSSEIMYPPAIWKFSYDSAITDGGHYSALVGVNQSLFNKRFANARLQTVALQKLTTRNQQKITETDLKEAITAQYIAAFSVYSRIQFEKTILALLNEERSSLKIFVDKGIYQLTDYLNLSVSITTREIEGKQLFMDYKNYLAILNLICGIHDTATAVLVKPDIGLRTEFDPGQSPAMIQFRIDSLGNRNEILLADQQYLPRINAFADAGINAVNPRRIPYNLGTSVGVNFMMPLYDGRQRQMERDKIQLRELSRRNYQLAYRNQYLQKRDQLLEQLELTQDLELQIGEQMKELEKLISLYKTEISRGLARWLDFLSVINQYEEVKNTLVQTGINRLSILNQLNYLK
jgi:outer membrane protein TolC